ncbi:hypothetical protein [Sphingomonas sp. Leaf37]|uniref:hypothetical protein n=1 Tax=Sphingomonas sp. Leaf37 TaxID=2876552 RepID=UPI001E32C02D|nr:hypothetical protein [Sphingomonas sp. Leaf37]
MRHLAFAAAIVLAMAVPAAARSQTAPSIAAPAGFAPMQAPCIRQADGSCAAVSADQPLPVGQREAFRLANANTPSAAATVFGGQYILSQACSGYGTLNLQVLGPDSSTYQTVISKAASDTTGGTSLALGSYAVVRITIAGTTACNAVLARVPA